MDEDRKALAISTTSQAVKNPGEKTYEEAASGTGMITAIVITITAEHQNATRTSANRTC